MDIVAHIIICKSDDSIANFFEIFCASFIIFSLCLFKMLVSVNFYAQFCLGTIKVDNKLSYRVLTTKFITKISVSQMLPECCLCGCLWLAQLSRSLAEGGVGGGVFHSLFVFACKDFALTLALSLKGRGDSKFLFSSGEKARMRGECPSFFCASLSAIHQSSSSRHFLHNTNIPSRCREHF